MDSGIYAVIAPELNIIYIGQSHKMKQRWSTHRHNMTEPGGNRRCNKLLRHACQKHGIHNFDFIVIEHCSVEKLTAREAYWLARVRASGRYRVANTEGPCDNPMRGQKHRPETIEKLRAASASMVRTDAHRKAIGDAHRGRKRSPEFCAKVSASKRGKKLPSMAGDLNPSRRPEHRERMTGEGNPAKRPDVRAKMSAAASIPVEDAATGEVWASQSACALRLGVTVQAVNRHIRGLSKTCRGRVLRYALANDNGLAAEVAA